MTDIEERSARFTDDFFKRSQVGAPQPALSEVEQVGAVRYIAT
jgi:hypothetical protein